MRRDLAERDFLTYEYPEFIAALLYFKRKKGWSNAEISRQCSVVPATVTDWLKDRYLPGIATVRKMAEVFDVSMEDFWRKGQSLVEERRREERERRRREAQEALEVDRDAHVYAEALMQLDERTRLRVLDMVAERTAQEKEEAAQA